MIRSQRTKTDDSRRVWWVHISPPGHVRGWKYPTSDTICDVSTLSEGYEVTARYGVRVSKFFYLTLCPRYWPCQSLLTLFSCLLIHARSYYTYRRHSSRLLGVFLGKARFIMYLAPFNFKGAVTLATAITILIVLDIVMLNKRRLEVSFCFRSSV